MLKEPSQIDSARPKILSIILKMWLLLVDFACRTILTLCHWLYSLKLRLKFVKMMVANWWYEAGYLLCDKTTKENFEIKYVEEKTKQLSKIPAHLCLALGEDDTSYEQLDNLIAWSVAAGVSVLSFYDHKNGE